MALQGPFVKTVKDYDDAGNVILCEYYGANGQLTNCSGGYAKYTAKYNELKQQTWIEFFGEDGMPMNYDGYSIREREFDGDGNVSIERYFDANEEPIACRSGYYEIRKIYDGRNVVNETYFDQNGQPMEVKGAYGLFYIYNENGKVEQRLKLDMDGNLLVIVE